jgi:hypothetical protein
MLYDLVSEGLRMKKNVSQKRCTLVETLVPPPNPEIKCVTVMVFEEAGKTILQPLVTGTDARKVQELFANKTLEVWLPNGQSNPAQFDVNILKYKQQIQTTKKCSISKNLVCLKNQFETIVSCEQCPVSNNQIHK